MNTLEQFSESAESHDEKLVAVGNATQVKLAEDLDVDFDMWIARYADSFRKILSADPTILEDLADNTTHDETFEELKTKLYH